MTDAEKAAEAHVKSLRETYPEIYPTDLERARSNFLAGYAAAMQWRPIESAPMDGTKVIGKIGETVSVIYLQDYYEKWPHQPGGPTFRKEWTKVETSALVPCTPTGWLPLPPSE